jgi:uncharacterized repeat protein (TIGR01451 family)
MITTHKDAASNAGAPLSLGKPYTMRFRPLLCALLLAGSLLASSNAARAAIVNEPMTGATAPGWVIGGSAYLTASTGVDPAGSGWLRLTEPLNNQAGFAFFDSPFDISQGVVISFDYATWGGNGADGYSIFLLDGSYDGMTFSVGASGGSLGYAQKTVVPVDPGLTGGYIGVGVDEYGNYSNPTEGRIGGPGAQANAVGVRGPYNHPSGAYYWLGGSGALGTQLAFNGQLYRPIQTGVQYRKVVIYLTPVAAPNYLRVDTYIQFGYNQPLTAVVTGLFTGRPMPASVKIGYAASTGGQNNYHEIRNLLIDPLQTDIDLAMTKTVSSPTATPGGTVVYTLTARNSGPYTSGTATNMPVTDTIPALMTGATWTCVGAGGGTCGAASGSGNINTTATLPFNGSVSYTIRSTVVGTATPGSTITNTATLTPPSGITDYNASNNSSSVDIQVTGPTVTLSGTIFSDANHNGARNAGEGSPGLATIYAKLFRSSDMTTALQAVLYTAGTGSYAFSNVPSYGNYTILLSTNNTLTDPTPIDPNANWIYTLPANYTLSNIAVDNTSVSSLDFGLYNGSRVSGKVINDNGLNGAPSNANDGILNAAETGIAGVTVSLRNNTGGTTYDTTTTDSGGNFALYTNTATATLRIYETNLAGYLSVNANTGNTGGTYTIGGEYISFGYTLYGNNATGGYRNVIFSDVQDNTFTPAAQGQSNLPTYSVYYGHTFTPNTGGTVSFSTASRSQAGWPALVYYQDTNCNSSYDAGDIALPASFTTSAGTPICILVKDTIPSGATLGTTDQIVTRASFTFTNSSGPVTGTNTVTDTTTVAPPGASVTVSGAVYGDANHNGLLDGGEASLNVAGIYAKLFTVSNLTSALSVTSVTQATGAYSFVSVPTNTNYVIILSSTNGTNYDPSFPNTQWVATVPANYTLVNVAVGGANLSNQNFGVFNGTRIDGQVLKDDGAAVGANANNAVQNAGEAGIAGQTISVCDNASCTAIDTETTDGGGFFSLYVPWATNFATARITQTTMPSGYSMVNYSPGSAAGSGVNLGSRYITFTFTRGNDVAGLVFSDVPANTFTPTPLSQTGSQTAQLTYAHTFTPASGGVVSFATSTRTQPGWSAAVYYQDANCNGIYDAGDSALPASISTVAGTPVCILMQETILATAPSGTTDQLVTRATFTHTNSFGPVVLTYDATDTTTVQTPNLATSTKSWTDVNGGGVNAGDLLEYTITIVNSTATATAYNVTVTDNIPANTNGFTVVSIPALATDLSTTTGGSNGTGYLNVSGITVPPGGSVTIVFDVFINGSAAAGTTITNTATITQPNGTVTSRTAPAATVVAVSGTKLLYLYSAATYTLSRTIPSGAPVAVAIAPGASQTWTQLPAAAGNMTIDPAVSVQVPVVLQAGRSGGSAGNVSLTVTLQCSAGGTALTTTANCNSGNEPATNQCTLNLPLAATLTCSAGNGWRLTILNNSGTRTLYMHPVSSGGGAYSSVNLPATTVISVSSVNSYIATYPSTTAPAAGYFTGGQTAYVRTVVSDPFGSYDIVSAPTITVRDPSSAAMASGTMTLVNNSGGLTKTFEYVYTVPATGPSGVWTANINAPEGTENQVSDNGVGTFRVLLQPNIVIAKSVQIVSDPYNLGVNPKAIPGATMLYDMTVTNQGNGTADAIAVADGIPQNTALRVTDIGGPGPVIFINGATASGLSYSFNGLGSGTDNLEFSNDNGATWTYTPVPDGNGVDMAVTNIRVPLSGTFNGASGPNQPSFTLRFQVVVK